jgi:hypothetical protein
VRPPPSSASVTLFSQFTPSADDITFRRSRASRPTHTRNMRPFPKARAGPNGLDSFRMTLFWKTCMSAVDITLTC